jgi:hypothetical protein
MIQSSKSSDDQLVNATGNPCMGFPVFYSGQPLVKYPRAPQFVSHGSNVSTWKQSVNSPFSRAWPAPTAERIIKPFFPHLIEKFHYYTSFSPYKPSRSNRIPLYQDSTDIILGVRSQFQTKPFNIVIPNKNLALFRQGKESTFRFVKFMTPPIIILLIKFL